MSSIYNIDVTTIDGETKSLSEYQGKTLLIVNVASKCGLTPQYEALEALYQEKKAQGLEVLGFPCNQFAGQEPGDEAEIKSFCTMNFGVQFPMFAKIDVNGENRHPLYSALLSAKPERTTSPGSGFEQKLKDFGIDIVDEDIMWNFEKFLVNGDGEVIGHFAPDMTPSDAIMKDAIEQALA